MKLQRVYCIILLSVLSTIACDETSVPLDEDLSAGPRLIFDFNRLEYSASGTLGEFSFPLPNDAMFKSSDNWVLIDKLANFKELEAWREDVSLLGGASLLPLISAPLNQEIKLDELILRHSNSSLADDALYLLCLSPLCEGELVPLDMGRAAENYGVFLELNTIAENNTSSTADHLTKLSAPIPEALIDESSTFGSFSDLSRVLAQFPNAQRSLVWSDEQQSSGQILLSEAPSLGERSRILSFRPSQLLKVNTEYAVVLTSALKSTEGSMSTSVVGQMPKSMKQKIPQVKSLMSDFGVQSDEIAVAWTFTTGDPMAIKRTLRQTLSMHGDDDHPLNTRVASFKPSLKTVHRWASGESEEACQSRGGSECRVDIEQVALPAKGVRGLAIAWAEQYGINASEKTALYNSYKAVKGLFSGELNGWYVSTWQGTPNGEGLIVKDISRSFWCVIPESGDWVDETLNRRQRQAPFPVLMWSSDSTDERLNLLLWAGYFARAGYASCAIESSPNQRESSDDSFALNLSISWRDYGWSPSLAAQILGSTQDQSGHQIQQDHFNRARPLNRSLALYQLAWWLGQPGDSELDTELETLKALTLLPSEVEGMELVGEQSEHKHGGLVYGGEGEGATVAALSATIDEYSSALVTVDMAADLLHHQVTGLGRSGADVFLNRSLGPWLIWDQNIEGWRWSKDSVGEPPLLIENGVEDLSSERLEAFKVSQVAASALEGQWVALYNHRTEKIGEKHLFSTETKDLIALSVPVRKGDLLSLQVYTASDDSEPNLVTDQKLIAPFSAAGASPGSEYARLQWRLNQWSNALDDPIESSYAMINDIESRHNELRSLVIAHPRSIQYPLAGSLRMSQAIGLLSDENRSDLYGLDVDEFLLLTQAYEPMRALGEPWMDWDDLDLLEYPTPSFTRNTQLSLGRSAYAGGYHALKMPWRLAQNFGLTFPNNEDEPLETLTINLINRFLSGIPRNANIEELEEACLHYLAPSVKACLFLSVTSQDMID